MKVKIGESKIVDNDNKYNSASDTYIHVFVHEGDEVKSLLLTHNEYEVAIERARRNSEDIPDLQLPQVIVEGVTIKSVTHDKGDLLIEVE